MLVRFAVRILSDGTADVWAAYRAVGVHATALKEVRLDMWVAISIFIVFILGFLPLICFLSEAISDWIEAKADEIRARAEKLRRENESKWGSYE